MTRTCLQYLILSLGLPGPSSFTNVDRLRTMWSFPPAARVFRQLIEPSRLSSCFRVFRRGQCKPRSIVEMVAGRNIPDARSFTVNPLLCLTVLKSFIIHIEHIYICKYITYYRMIVIMHGNISKDKLIILLHSK